MNTSDGHDPHERLFRQMRALFDPVAPELAVQQDDAASFYLNTGKPDGRGKPVFFGAVYRKKDAVHIHLMAVYAFPELLEPASASLRGRLKGKSCFHIRPRDEALLDELQGLVASGFERYRAEGLV